MPVSSWTMAAERSKQVEITGITDKRQSMAVFANTMSGNFLPLQIMYSGKTARSLPSVKFPCDWHVTYMYTCTQITGQMKSPLRTTSKRILLPYVVQKWSELSLPIDNPALVIFDQFKVLFTERILSLLDNNHIHMAIVPASFMDRLQPLDVRH